MARRRSGNRPSTAVVITGERELMSRLNAMARDIKKDITKEALMEGAKIVQQAASSKAWGSVAQAILIEADGNKVKIGPDKDHWYAVFQEFGVKRHVIRIKTKSILTDGEKAFGREVHHPGVRKQPFLRPALDDNEDEIRRAMADVIRRRLGVT